MPRFKVGDRISNGKIEYTVIDIGINGIGDLCYIFNHPSKNTNFRWVTSQVDQMFELVEDNDNYDDYWKDFRAKAAKDILCSVILTFEPKGNFKQSLNNAIDRSIEAADRLIIKLKKSDDSQNRVVKAIANKYKD
jgi:hypothetical protein